MNPRRISVVVPARNEEKFLPDLLAALERQTRTPDEVIVVDNLSRDATPEIARAWGARVVLCDTPGVAFARNAGLHAATGEWIATTDADSLPDGDWLAAFEPHMERSVALYGPMRFHGLSPRKDAASEVAYRAFLGLMAAAKRPNLGGANMAYSRAAALLVGGYAPVEAREDVLLGFALARVGTVRYVPSALVRTSARRMSGGLGRFVWQHVKNLGGQSEGYFAHHRPDGPADPNEPNGP